MHKILKPFTMFCGMLLAGCIASACSPANVSAATPNKITVERTENDFTVDLQNALDTNRSSSSPLEITVAPGTYNITDNLKIYPNTTLNLDKVTLKNDISDSNMSLFRLRRLAEWEDANGKKGYSAYSGGSNITFNGGTFDGCGKSGALIRLGHASDITLTNVTFKNVQNGHHVELGGCKNVNITNCTFSDFSGKWTSNTNYEALQLEICTKGHFSSYAPYDNTPCSNVTVTGCTFTNLQKGMGTHVGYYNKYPSNIKIQKNNFTNIRGYAIIATNYANSVITENTITNCGSGIMFRTMDQSHATYFSSKKKAKIPKMNSIIANNVISVSKYHSVYNNVSYGISVYGEKLKSKKAKIQKGDYQVRGVTLQGNTVYLGITGYAIWLQGSVGNTVKENTITSHCQIKGRGGNGDGIRLQKSASNKILNNNITCKRTKYSKQMVGICITTASHKTVVTGNTITKPSKDGIMIVSSKKIKLQKNKIKSAKRYGVLVCEKSSVTKFKKNKISKCGSKKTVVDSNSSLKK